MRSTACTRRHAPTERVARLDAAAAGAVKNPHAAALDDSAG